MKNEQLILFLSGLAIFNSYAQDNWYEPDDFKFQFAGNIGLLSLGLGEKFLDNKLDGSVFYGYVPQSVGGKDISAIALKVHYHVYEPDTTQNSIKSSSYIGSALIYTHNVELSTREKEFKGVSEYPINTVHLMPYLGMSFSYAESSNNATDYSSLYIELGILDTYLEDYLSKQNSKSTKLTDFVNASIGISHPF